MILFDTLSKWLGALSNAHIAWFTARGGACVGQDAAGNRYFRRAPLRGRPERRWVIFAGAPEASSVPPEWHGWLHQQTDAVPSESASPLRRSWQKPWQPNSTGTDEAYLPPGHTLDPRPRAASTGDYEAWSPPA